MTTALLILRTPFQAWLAQRVLKEENIESYDLLYFTQNNSKEDQFYFKLLAKNSKNRKYSYITPKPFDILNHLYFMSQTKSWFRDLKHDLTLIASIDALVPNAIASRQNGQIITFDDGTANFNKSSSYHTGIESFRYSLYSKMIGASTLQTIRSRIARHYTIYNNFENIVENSRLRYLDKFSERQLVKKNKPKLTYFIGQPFSEALSASEILSLKQCVQKISIDRYVRHPRESQPLSMSAPLLDKDGQIAEDAILHDARQSPVHVIGCFSTVLFNLEGLVDRRTMLLSKQASRTPYFAELAKKSGCEIVYF